MGNNSTQLLTNCIKYTFYVLFFLTPLLINGKTSELFEFNKMWFVFFLALIILFLWGSKIIITQKFNLRKTPLDIPIALFLISQFISTLLSLDSYTSFWGYYSRFNGGLLSSITYIFLYYAFASNLIKDKHEKEEKPVSYMMLLVSFFSGVAVTLWGLPSHFGVDPNCIVLRGSIGVDCWTEAFQPKLRIFSTLGQPNWLAAFLAALIPVALGFTFLFLKNTKSLAKSLSNKALLFLASVFFFYLALFYTGSQSGFLGIWTGFAVFSGFALTALLLKKKTAEEPLSFPSLAKEKIIAITTVFLLLLGVMHFFKGFPIERLNSFSYQGITTASKTVEKTPTAEETQKAPAEALGGTDSGTIRLIVWKGALEVFKQHPLFGSGVETFAYAYYKVKPIEHNLTSEWDYLYNKAHNEYLNFLATTGIVGFAAYLSLIGLFLFLVIRSILLKGNAAFQYFPLVIGTIAGYITILVTNFFGFSVVNINLFFFFFPLFVIDLSKNNQFGWYFSKNEESNHSTTSGQKTVIAIWGVIILIFIGILFNYWRADRKYALGNNLDKVGQYGEAYPHLKDAVQLRPGEPVFQDERSINLATIALFLAQNNSTTEAAQLAAEAKQLSDAVMNNHPNNVVYYKTRTRVLYTLSQIDSSYLSSAIQAIEKAHQLAPTDAKIAYNMALLYQQAGRNEQAHQYLEKAIQLKKNYRDAYYALALLLSQEAEKLKNTDPTTTKQMRTKAKDLLQYTLQHNVKNDKEAKELLDSLEHI